MATNGQVWFGNGSQRQPLRSWPNFSPIRAKESHSQSRRGRSFAGRNCVNCVWKMCLARGRGKGMLLC